MSAHPVFSAPSYKVESSIDYCIDSFLSLRKDDYKVVSVGGWARGLIAEIAELCIAGGWTRASCLAKERRRLLSTETDATSLASRWRRR